MTQRHDILQEYFSLVKDLNQTNKFKIEQTQIIFEIEEIVNNRSILIAKISKEQKIRLCCLMTSKIWMVDQNTRYVNLSEWLVKLLHAYNNQKFDLKMTFNDYFKMKFDALLAFKS